MASGPRRRRRGRTLNGDDIDGAPLDAIAAKKRHDIYVVNTEPARPLRQTRILKNTTHRRAVPRHVAPLASGLEFPRRRVHPHALVQRPLLYDIDLDDVAEPILNLEPVPDRRLHRHGLAAVRGPDVLLGPAWTSDFTIRTPSTRTASARWRKVDTASDPSACK